MKDYVRHQRSRMFESDFFEFFSKVHPSTPFILYIPAGLFILGYALATGVTTPLWAAAMLPVGWFAWQIMEWSLHKSLFHWEGNTPFTRRMHQILHGYHHDYPDDDQRLVMPIGASLPVVLLIAGLLYLVGVPHLTLPFWAGMLFGYLWYDFIHYSTHFRKPTTEWGKRMRSHHMAHHFAVPDKNFGISHMWLDRFLGTLRVRETGAKHD
ncbi:MAG: sterol desaturase family protein [Myxococcaceae bacterium]|nr:sterol desaturase family protein [Myxococcaceae bacterium]